MKVKISTPTTPNFLKTDVGLIPIENFTNEELRDMANDWLSDLIKKAEIKRN